MSTELALLRSTLQDLQSYELPPNYRIDQGNDRNNNSNANNANNDNDNNGDDDDNDDDNDGTTSPFLFQNSQLLRRYKSARDSYIQQRTFEMFLTSLQNYDPVTNTIPLPNDHDDRDDDEEADDGEEKLRKRQMEVMESIQGTMRKMTGDMDEVRSKWEQFCIKREELVRIVEGMERGERQLRLEGCSSSSISDTATQNNAKINNDDNGCSNLDDDDDDDNDDEEITDEDVTLQEEKLDELRQRKLALEERLRSVRAEILDVEDDCHATKRAVNEVRARGGRKPLDWRGVAVVGSNNGNDAATANNSDEGGIIGNNAGNEEGGRDEEADENAEYISVVARGVDAEIAEMEEKAAEWKASCEMYDGYRELMEELGGVKILSSRSIPPSSATDGENPEKRRKFDEEAEEGFVLTLLLLEKHILEITLSKTPNDEDDGGLRVSDARLTTPTAFPMPGPSTDGKASNDENNNNNNNNEMTTSLVETMHSVSLSNLSFSKIMSQKPSAEVTIPPLDDLVSWSRSLERPSSSASSSSSSSSSPHGIRFVIAETMARLRTSHARVVELAALRVRYAAQVYDVDSSAVVHEQEVVCAIEEGITVALRLGADCPMVPGSVYVSEMFGVGGWEEWQLEELKGAVERRRCRGPVEAMECLVDEIRRRGEGGEEGWEVPATPTLPRRRME